MVENVKMGTMMYENINYKERGKYMKQAAKIFLIIGMVIRAITIIPLILGIVTLKRLDEAKSKDELGIALPILSIFFVNLIAGIIMLCMKDEDFQA